MGRPVGGPDLNIAGLPGQDLSPADIQRISDAVDAACPRFILIVHPNFKLPEGFHMKPLDRSHSRGGLR
jgi:hypothetical protein